MIRFPANIRRFRPQSSRSRKLPFHAAPNLRIAQVSAANRRFDLVEMFPSERWCDLETFRPRVLVGLARDLLALAEQNKNRSLDLSSVDHAVLVLTECGSEPATDVFRVVLWQAFGVPVFELLASHEGSVLASECQAQEGWHVESGANFYTAGNELIYERPGSKPVRSGFSGTLETETCPCGRPGMRLMNIERLNIETSRARDLAREFPRELAATA